MNDRKEFDDNCNLPLKETKRLKFMSRVRAKLREFKNEVKNDIHTIIHMDKKELFTKIFSSRYFVLFMFLVILVKTLFFLENTVFYRHGIWLWHIRQTSFFIIIMVAPLLLCRKSRTRFTLGMILNFLISLLLFADELYYLYASNIISVMQARKLAVQRRDNSCNTITFEV